MSSATDELRHIFEHELPAAVRAGDVDAYMALWGGESCLWSSPGRPDAFGREQIREAVSALLIQEAIDPTFVADEVQLLGEHGYVLGTSRQEITPSDGGPSSIAHSRELWLFVREDGAWRINCIVFNDKPS